MAFLRRWEASRLCGFLSLGATRNLGPRRASPATQNPDAASYRRGVSPDLSSLRTRSMLPGTPPHGCTWGRGREEKRKATPRTRCKANAARFARGGDIYTPLRYVSVAGPSARSHSAACPRALTSTECATPSRGRWWCRVTLGAVLPIQGAGYLCIGRVCRASLPRLLCLSYRMIRAEYLLCHLHIP